MGKYSSLVRKKELQKPDGPPALWRGLGCLMMVIIPIISFAAGYETINYGIDNGWPIPAQLLGLPRFPDFVYLSTGLMAVLSPVAGIPHFYGYVVAGILYVIALGGLTSILYAVAYRLVGPPRYGPLDVERPNVKVKRYKR
jgi:hypothetical protein